MIKKSVSLIAFATVLGAFGGAYAAAGDNAIVTSKAYVDNTKQEKISGHAANAADSLLTDSATDGTVQKRAIFNDTAANYDSTTQSTQIPTMGAVMSAISGGTTALPWATAEQNATGAYSTTFANSGTNVWPTADADKVVKGETFANAMATKQNKISGYDAQNGTQSVLVDSTTDGVVGKMQIVTAADNTGDPLSVWVDVDDMIPTVGMLADAAQDKIPARATKIDNNDQTFAPSVVTNGTTDGSVGQMAIITYDRMHSDGFSWDDYANNDSLIPTLGAVGMEVERMTPPVLWNTAEQNATDAYSTTFADTGTNVWPSTDRYKFVNGYTFANALAVKQNKIGAENANLIPGQQDVTGMRAVLAPTDTAGMVNQIGLWDADGMDGTAWDLSNTTNYYGANWTGIDAQPIRRSIPTVGAVEVGLNNKQNKIAGHAANAADSLLTDSATNGVVQKRAIFTDGTTYVAGTHATQIPTMGAVMSAVSAGVSAAAPSGTANTIANYGANGALGSGIATYSGATQQSPYNAGNDAGKIATAAAVETKQTKKVCYGWPDDVEHTDANCWLWTLPD